MSDRNLATRPTVSVIIPTIGRPELARAIRSARAQQGDIDVEIIVVNDAAQQSATAGVDADTVVWTGGGRRGGYARNRGVAAGGGDHVAFLDDDDEWLPDKLIDQLRLVLAADDPEQAVIGGRHVHVAEHSGKTSAPCPDTLISPGQSVAEYLFRRRRPAVGRPSMYTSTLLCSRRLATEVPWREDLSRHQDWDWLIRLGRVDGTTFAQATSVVARIQTGSSQSISASADWAASKRWADEMLLDDDGVYVDFLFGQTLRYALNARSGRGVADVVRSAVARRRLPASGPALLGLAGLVPRRRMERLMTRPDAKRLPA